MSTEQTVANAAAEGVVSDGVVGEGVVHGEGRTAVQIAQAIDPTRTLTREQEGIVGAGLTPTLVVAGAGSGKTETLSQRILYLLDNARTLWGRDIAPSEILCLTFTRKAASEIAVRAAERIEALYGKDPARPEVNVATYNGYAASLVADHGLRVAVDPDSTVLTGAALWQLATRVVEEWTATLRTDSAVGTVTSAIARLAAQMRDHRVSPMALREWATATLAGIEELPRTAGDDIPGEIAGELASPVAKVRTLVALADLVEDFDRRKRDGSFLDYSDQIEIAVRLAQLPHVQAIEAAAYRAVLLDEFQDTSPPQLELFAHLFGDGHPVMAVGDPHQAIYGFRGASAEALERFVTAFSTPTPVDVRTLSVSWRNSTEILHAANAVVAPLKGGAVQGVPLRSRGEETGTPEPQLAVPGVTAIRSVTHLEEADAVAGFIAGRRAELGHRPQRPVTAAVLCRRRSQFSAIAEALALAGIPYEIVGLGGLLDIPEVADVLALLEVAHDPSRGDSMMRLLAGERVALGPRDLAALYDWAQVLAGPRTAREGQASIVDAVADLPPTGWVSYAGRELSDEARVRLADLAQVIDTIRRHTYLPLVEMLAFAERAWGLDIEVAVAQPRMHLRRAMDAFIDAARTFSAGAEHATVGAFLAWLEAARREEGGLDTPVSEPDPSAVQLITVHGSKGLEWDVVAIPGLNDGHFPSINAPTKTTPFYSSLGWLDGIGNVPHELRLDGARLPVWDTETAADHGDLRATFLEYRKACGRYTLGEERRLFYVALTRARSHVLLSGAWYPGTKRPTAPSLYVTELLDQERVTRGPWEDKPTEAPSVDQLRAPVPWPPTATVAQERRRDLADRVEVALAHGVTEPDPALPLVRELTAMIQERAARREAPVSLPPHLSTSALVALRRDRDAFAAQVRRPMPQEPTFAAQRGSDLHAWIERHFGHTMLWDDDEDDMWGAEDEVDADLARLRETFAASAWAGRTPIAVEVDVEFPVGGITVRSRIDAVFPAGGGLERVTVVDWKSGRPPADAAEREAREVQLAVYRLAWATWKEIPVEDVDAAFYYVATDTTVHPQRLLTRAEIEALIAGQG